MTNLVSSELIKIDGVEIELVDRYIYLRHEVRVNRDNQSCKLTRRITLGWIVYGRQRDIFKANL